MSAADYGITPGRRHVQLRGDLSEYHVLDEEGNIIGRFYDTENAKAEARVDALVPELLKELRAVTSQLDDLLRAIRDQHQEARYVDDSLNLMQNDNVTDALALLSRARGQP